MKRNLWVFFVSLAVLMAGCSKVGERTDAQIQADVQSKISADNSVPDKQLTVATSGGIVTLSGNVSSDAARNAAASDAGQIAGVKTVINNLQVVPTSAAANQPPQTQEQASNNPPPPVRDDRRPSPSKKSLRPSPRNNSDNGNTSYSNPPNQTPQNDNGNDVSQSTTPPVPVAPPAPVKITVPAGTQLSIRLNDEVDSEKAQVGDVFHGSLSAPVTVDDDTVLPTTADVEGRVVDVKSAGRFAGQSVLTLELTKLVMNGRTYSIHTDQWTKSGNGRGKSTAAKVGGGAAVGAILGGILGGGKGAAIGATAGAGAGTGVAAAGKGQQIILHPEQVIAFQLQNSVTVTPGTSRPAMNQ